MSLKPPKKSDLNKSWMKKKPDRAIKIHPEYHLIVTEGTDTEPAYFGAIKELSISDILKRYIWMSLEKEIILLVCLEGRNSLPEIIQMYISMFGLCMILMISQRTI